MRYAMPPPHMILACRRHYFTPRLCCRHVDAARYYAAAAPLRRFA